MTTNRIRSPVVRNLRAFGIAQAVSPILPGERRHRHRLGVNDEAPREFAPNP
ncbi:MULTISPECIES: hypothetical protein [Cupriavidus]|jgi:hypothetical protein|uniref:hypothetical protein n=1 Tax=Cupriavidus TaxID=106589 RepID=UPI0004B93B0B|nr:MULTISPECIES: hypothetical protein [Cupriavidus]QWC92032.1 hypothetical protein KB891_20080 [Cupriavidus metallidurans]